MVDTSASPDASSAAGASATSCEMTMSVTSSLLSCSWRIRVCETRKTQWVKRCKHLSVFPRTHAVMVRLACTVASEGQQ